MNWFVYMLRCADGSIYTGITKDLERRVHEHNFDNLLGAKSLRFRRPVSLAYYEERPSLSEAAKREKAIKRWKREYKLKLIEGFTLKIL